MKNSYQFHPNLVVRTPHFPLTQKVEEEQLWELLRHPLFLEALYLASPVLYEECQKLLNGQITTARDKRKIQHALVKYYTRMFSRCTPFGLFSGCSLVQWRENNTRMVIDPSEFDRHTRLDMHYLCALAQFLAGCRGVMEYIGFTKNSTLYTIGNEIRYIEYFYNQGKRTHKISAIVRTEYLDKIISLAQGFQPIDVLADALVEDDVSLDDAREFIRTLIEAQVLVSELEPAITGPEFTHQLISTLEKRGDLSTETIPVLLKFLHGTLTGLKALDDHKLNHPDKYKELQEMIKVVSVPFDESKLFQCDLSIKLVENSISDTYQQQLFDALEVVHRLSPGPEQKMEGFIQQFRQRYEDKELPLMEVLDAETGLVYRENTGVELSPLLNDMIFPKPPAPVSYTWGPLEDFWRKKLTEAAEENALIINLNDKDLENFISEERSFPPSLSLMFRIVEERTGLLYLESASGSSAANLLGRFAHGNPAIDELVKDITSREQALEKEVILAEIVHLPETRIGNILLHPAFRQYEIPYLAKASVDDAHQIPVQDLLVSIRHNRVVLRSKKLNKEIIPRLSSAHNYNIQPLPVYQFLCDLQMQGISAGFQFNWGDLSWQYRFLPRVQYKKTILHAATWNLRKEDWAEIMEASGEKQEAALDRFLHKWKIPSKVVIADGDNELLVDFSNTILLAVFLEQLKNRHEIILKEFLFVHDTGITDIYDQPYANQLIAVLQKKKSTYKLAISEVVPVDVPERFDIGSEWLYYKIYCGSQSAERILTQSVEPLIRELMVAGKIKKWFFIRYNDPAFHIRLRLELTNTSEFAFVLSVVSGAIQPFQLEGVVWNTQVESYQREIQRYGSRSIDAVEQLFFINSTNTLSWLLTTSGDERETERWLWGIQSIDHLLNVFERSLEEKLNLLEQLKISFANEFYTGKLLRDQLDLRYRHHRKQIESTMENGWQEMQFENEMKTLASLIRSLADQGLLEPSLDNLLGSLIHMQMNRLFTSKARQHEMVCYDFLFRYYFAQKMRNTYGNKEKIRD